MPSFDVVSQLDMHEVTNAVDQANREIGNRFDFKGTNAKIEQSKNVLTLTGQSEFQIRQVLEILYAKLAKRGIDIECAKLDSIQARGKDVQQVLTLREGIDTELAKTIVKQIKESKLKVQAAIQGEQVRVTGKKRDDLQDAIGLLRGAKLGLPLQYINFRD